LLERELAQVVAHDPHAPVATEPLRDAVAGADAVVVATNHAEFSSPASLEQLTEGVTERCLVVDPWNAFGAAQVFATVEEVVAGARARSLTRATA
jgi:UDP-N-acetyl-D-mannosaminuronic acid dehydrogenase